MKQYAYKDMIIPAVFIVIWSFIACLFMLAMETLWETVMLFLMILFAFILFYMIFEITCFDETGFYSVNVFGKRRYEVLWQSIEKVERRKEHDYRTRDINALRGWVYIAVYNNEYFLEPVLFKRTLFVNNRYTKRTSHEAVMLLTPHERAIFIEWLERKRPDLHIERHESAI